MSGVMELLSKETKKCTRCNKEKDKLNFQIAEEHTDGLASCCKSCAVKDHWKRQLHHNYNLTVKQYELMLKTQNRVCKICNKSETRKGRNGAIQRLCVDHCHKPFKVRGLLCDKCNVMLGAAKDNPEILKQAIKYLEENQ